MTIKNIAERLISQGHKVKVYIRPDGGRRIIEVDGLKFSSSNQFGNVYARSLLGEKLTAKQQAQRRANIPLAKAGKEATRKPFYIDKQGRRKFRKNAKKPQSLTIRKGDTLEERRTKNRIRRLRRKLKAHGQQTDAKILRKRIARFGLEDTAHVLANKTRKDAGLAYPAAVDAFIDYMRMVSGRYPYESMQLLFQEVENKLEFNKKRLADSLLSQDMSRGIYPLVYEIEKICRDYASANSTEEPHFIGYADEFDKRITSAIQEAEAISKVWGIDLEKD